MADKTPKAALYVRSSKDRSDVSIDAQRVELQKLAVDRGILIITEYADVVESAKDENRPAFQRLLLDLKSSAREWDTLLMVDTSRLSRNIYIAYAFKHEAEKRAVKIVYSKVPEASPMMDVVIQSVMHAFDQMHSMMSREKGLAGMAENVRQGFRAGGRAPRGYKLKPIPTGAIRDGERVTKSILEKANDAQLVAQYLKGRAAGLSRKAILVNLTVPWPATTLIDMEWNALTYAGHTVWNVTNERKKGQGYKGGTKRKPQSEWVIQRETHEPLITDAEAEAILQQLESTPHRTRKYRTSEQYLLSGLLVTPWGEPWHGGGDNCYRVKAKRGASGRVKQDAIEKSVVGHVLDAMDSDAFIEALAKEARKYAALYEEDPASDLRRHVGDLTRRISKMMDMAGDMAEPGPALRKIDELEQERKATQGEIARLEKDYTAANTMRNIREPELRMMLRGLRVRFDNEDREALKDLLATIVERVELDPTSLECRLHYRLGIGGEKMASPWGTTEIPGSAVLRLVTIIKVAA